MAYDADLADRLRVLLGAQRGVSEKRMFGGIAFLLDGHMAVCASSQGNLMVRVDAAEQDELLTLAGVEPMEMRGRPMAGWLRVELTQVRSERQLQTWVARGVACARALPPKQR